MKQHFYTFLAVISALIINESIWRFVDRKAIKDAASKFQRQLEFDEHQRQEKMRRPANDPPSVYELNQQKELEFRKKNAANSKNTDTLIVN
jgi:hypothetical protein